MALWVVIPIAIGCVCLLIMAWAKHTKPRNAAIPEHHTPSFSASDYLERIEKASLEILSGLEKKEKYTLILWAGLDGLRMKEDGTFEWIKRDVFDQIKPRKDTLENVTQPYVPCAYSTNYYGNLCNTQNAIASLQAQNAALTFEILQAQQNQNIINSIRPSYMQTPLGYDISLTQCCCNFKP